MSEQQPKPHPHAYWIKLWADGIPIEYKACGKWINVTQFNTMTMPDIEYRIKPGNEPWKPKVGEKYFVISDTGDVDEIVKSICNISERRSSFGNCFRTRAEAEAAKERVKAALKGEIGDKVMSRKEADSAMRSSIGICAIIDKNTSLLRENNKLKEELESFIIRCEYLQKAKGQLISQQAVIDGDPLSDGEIALVKALRNGNIFKVYEGDSLLVFTDEDEGLRVDGYAIAFASAGRNDEIRACLKKIQKEQEVTK